MREGGKKGEGEWERPPVYVVYTCTVNLMKVCISESV